MERKGAHSLHPLGKLVIPQASRDSRGLFLRSDQPITEQPGGHRKVMSEISELESRISAAMERIGSAMGAMGSDTSAQEEAVRALEAQVVQLKEALDAEQTASQQLRERIEAMKGIKESQAIRIEELEAAHSDLQTNRNADRSEMDGIITELERLVQEGPHA